MTCLCRHRRQEELNSQHIRKPELGKSGVHTLYFIKNLNIYLGTYLVIAVLKFTGCEKAIFVSYRRRGLHTITSTLPAPDFDREG